MANGRKQKFKVEQPEIEIIVRVDEQELAAVAFFSAGGGGWDVVVGVSDPRQRDALKNAFLAAADAVEKAAFRPLASGFDAGGSDVPPF